MIIKNGTLRIDYGFAGSGINFSSLPDIIPLDCASRLVGHSNCRRNCRLVIRQAGFVEGRPRAVHACGLEVHATGVPRSGGQNSKANRRPRAAKKRSDFHPFNRKQSRGKGEWYRGMLKLTIKSFASNKKLQVTTCSNVNYSI